MATPSPEPAPHLVAAARVRAWLATGDAAAPRAVRAALRSANRTVARLRSGSVAAEMDRIVAETTAGTTGSGLSVSPSEVSARTRRRGGPR
ncbi:MAG: hypothetical protein M9942_00415 [Microthrixaceae bacterium]|nr:hypothetical protein [Microthrixaceae bacterium]MCO5316880.1 hypothetical protein [Microthrixaceae bacterium]